MSNWKNVNNWVNKNCITWARTYFTENVVGLQVEKDGHLVKVNKMEECNGDVEVCQRKGKIITIYDVNLKYTWEGVAKDGTIVAGTINVPEVAHDFDLDEYVFEISVKEEDALKRTLRDIVKKELTPLMRKQFSSFSDDLIKRKAQKIHIQINKL
ncbi:activator of Hsp90 ATPase [Cunninghamella echinulata]|nr:activator of Hsp90 ATPase [Cunninghamella echinulata]